MTMNLVNMTFSDELVGKTLLIIETRSGISLEGVVEIVDNFELSMRLDCGDHFTLFMTALGNRSNIVFYKDESGCLTHLWG